MLKIFLPGLLLLVAACQPEAPPDVARSPQFNIDRDRITVSGISSGAYMAGQMHIAHSAIFNGAALLAGGPYWCAENSLKQAIGPCVKGGDINLDAIQQYIAGEFEGGRIDDPANLANDPIWLFHGTNDSAVAESVSVSAKMFYLKSLPESRVQYVNDLPVVHGMPTIDTGMPCGEFGEPYLNACAYDAAGELLTHLYGPLRPRVNASGALQVINQSGFDEAELLESGYLYVPATCEAGESCGIHVAFHGCKQSTDFVGDAFARGAGFNEWAESNNLLVLYPQVASSKIAPMNPMGCWDWWGYTGDNYATKSGAQVAAVMTIMDSLGAADL